MGNCSIFENCNNCAISMLYANHDISVTCQLQRLARREALAGVISPAKFFDVGVPEGYREAVAAFPARA